MSLEISPTSWIHELLAQQNEQPITPRPRVHGSCTSEGILTYTQRGEHQDTLVANIGDGTDAINFLLVAADCPAHLRPLIDCLLGLAGDRTDWFESHDETVGMRARAGDGEMSREAAKKWVQRWRKSLIEWQTRKNLALIECSPGGQAPDGTRYPSRYKVNLLQLAVVTVEQARRSSYWKKDPSRALEIAAVQVLEDTPETPAYKPRFRAPRRNDGALLERNPKTALTLLAECARIMHERGEDVSAWWESFTQTGAERVLSVHTKDKDQWTNLSESGDSQGGLSPVEPVVVEATPMPDEAEQAASEACAALDAVSSVGVCDFIVTMKDEATGNATADDVSLAELAAKLPEYLERNSRGAESFIVRPNGGALIQVDDCTDAERDLLAPVSFMVAETSAGNYQAWIALPEETDDDERKRIRERLFKGALLGTRANVGAGNALRFPGSLNCKPERRRADGSLPRVRLWQASPIRFVTEAELQQAGLLAPDVPPCDSPSEHLRPVDISVHRSRVPSYDKCLRSVAKKENGSPDRSAADLLFAVTCLSWGLSLDETIALLKRESEKARARKDNYAERTVKLASVKVLNV